MSVGDAGTTATGHVLVWLRPVRGEVATATLDAVERARLASTGDEDHPLGLQIGQPLQPVADRQPDEVRREQSPQGCDEGGGD